MDLNKEARHVPVTPVFASQQSLVRYRTSKTASTRKLNKRSPQEDVPNIVISDNDVDIIQDTIQPFIDTGLIEVDYETEVNNLLDEEEDFFKENNNPFSNISPEVTSEYFPKIDSELHVVVESESGNNSLDVISEVDDIPYSDKSNTSEVETKPKETSEKAASESRVTSDVKKMMNPTEVDVKEDQEVETSVSEVSAADDVNKDSKEGYRGRFFPRNFRRGFRGYRRGYRPRFRGPSRRFGFRFRG